MISYRLGHLSGQSDRFLLLTEKLGNIDIYVMNADGGKRLRRLTKARTSGRTVPDMVFKWETDRL